MGLKEYHKKRIFKNTPEPRGKVAKPAKELRYVIQKHDASRIHYDFRIELDGVYKSWAVPKGPSLNPLDQRLAVQVEDHPIDYGTFEGVIPKGNYGAGTVMLWDSGTYRERKAKDRKESEKNLRKGLAEGHLTILMDGERLQGEFALIRLKSDRKFGKADGKNWLLIKKRDSAARYKPRADAMPDDLSVSTHRTMKQIADESEDRNDVWLPKGGRREKKTPPPPPPKPRPQLKKKEVSAKSPGRSEIPRRVKAMQAVMVPDPPEGPQSDPWLYEKALDGVRAIAEVGKTGVHLYSRSLLPLDTKYPGALKSLRQLQPQEFVLDGEIVANKKDSDFYAYDVLYADGKDLRETPLKERREILEKIQGINVHPLEKKVPASGDVIAKLASSVYHSGMSKDWVRFTVKGADKKIKESASEKPALTNLSKIYFPDDGYTKGDLIEYYESVAKYLVPFLRDRPESLRRQPDGIRNEGFFHKDQNGFVPRRVETTKVYSGSSGRTINYLLCQDTWTLLYLVNMGCIELNPWLSRVPNLDNPDFVVIDLDPDGNSYDEVVQVAKEVHKVLDSLGAEIFCKTSGASGMHLCVPTGAKFDFDECRIFAQKVCELVHKKTAKLTSVERNPAKRRGKIYLDYLQNRRGQTLAAPYCVRGLPGAPVSTPLKWSEVKKGLDPKAFTIKTIQKRLNKFGDLWENLLNSSFDIKAATKRLS